MHDDTCKWVTIAVLSYVVGYFVGKENTEDERRQETKEIEMNKEANQNV